MGGRQRKKDTPVPYIVAPLTPTGSPTIIMLGDFTLLNTADNSIHSIKPQESVATLLQYGPQTARAIDLGRRLGYSQCFILIAHFGFTNK